jgi:Asp-tRNA(Asn)/Glu-tRNA(Gln) amidotransferase A subunit family amidase
VLLPAGGGHRICVVLWSVLAIPGNDEVHDAKACFEQIETYNGEYNALIYLDPATLDDARDIDRQRAAGDGPGPLAGVPVVIKDPMDMVGFPTTAGWSLLNSKTGGADLMPATDAPVVAHMRAAGAIMLGKTIERASENDTGLRNASRTVPQTIASTG